LRALTFLIAAPSLALGATATPVLAAPHAASDYSATLQPGQEKNPGPSGAAGTARISIDGTNLCYDLSWNAATGQPNAAHIHQGPPNTDGPIVVVLSPTTKHTCTVVTALVAQGIGSNPGGYYVNLHTQQYLDGAIRGQLSKG
jgi:hypothetical protein